MPIPKRFYAEDAANVLGNWAESFESTSQAPVFEELAEPLNEGIAMNFAHKQGPGYDWRPHSPVTVQKHGPHPLLVLTGDMYRSITQRGSPYRIEEILDRGLTVGTSLFYAKYQEFGTEKIPKRRFAWLHDEDKNELHRKYADLIFSLLVDGL